MTQPTVSILLHFAGLTDPRIIQQKKHQRQDIFFITLCTVICGADNRVEIEEYGCAKENWLTSSWTSPTAFRLTTSFDTVFCLH